MDITPIDIETADYCIRAGRCYRGDGTSEYCDACRFNLFCMAASFLKAQKFDLESETDLIMGSKHFTAKDTDMQQKQTPRPFPREVHIFGCCKPQSPAEALTCAKGWCKHLGTCIKSKTKHGQHIRALVRALLADVEEAKGENNRVLKEIDDFRRMGDKARESRADIVFMGMLMLLQMTQRLATLIVDLPESLQEPGDPKKPAWMIEAERRKLQGPVPCEDF